MAENNSSGIFDFKKKPENLTGLLFGLPIMAGLLYGAYKLMPYIVVLLKSTLTAGLLGVACFVLFMIFTNKKFWKTMNFLYKSVMRKITNFFIDLDPINILKTYVHELKVKKEKMEQQIGVLRGHIQRVINDIKAHTNELENVKGLALEAKKQGKNQVATINAKQVSRLMDYIKELDGSRKLSERLYTFLSKYSEVADYMILDIENEVNMKEKMRQQIRASHSAMNGAMKIIKGDIDEKEMFDRAMDTVIQDYSIKMGEIEFMMKNSANLIDNFDLQSAVDEKAGFQLIESLEKDSLVFRDHDHDKNDLGFNMNSFHDNMSGSEEKSGFSNLFQ